MLHSVSTRIVFLSVVVAAAIGVLLALFFVAENDLKRANHATTRAADISEAALNLRAQVGVIESSLSAAVRSRSRSTAVEWQAAAHAWRVPAERLADTVQTEAQRRRTATITSLIEHYITDYAEPVLRIAEVDPATARSQAVVSEDRFRIAQITRQIDTMTRASARAAALRSRHANKFADRAATGGLVAAIVSPILLLLAGLWFMRGVARPLREVAEAASSVAAGDFSERLDGSRKDEFGTLARAFNRMTAALAANRDELVARAQRLEESEKRKSELISIVSHEVRTPLASVLGFTRLLLERDLEPDERREYLQIINDEATRLASLVSDFLDIRLLEDRRFPLRSNHVDIRPLVVEQATRMLATDDDHRLELRISDQPAVVLGDERRLTQVLTNLLSNAVKFSPAETQVTVGIDSTLRRVRVWVEDEGPGIAPEHADQLFEPFARGGAPEAGIPGAGIGLALSRRIVEAHGGRIGFENLHGGVRFWFELPSLPDAPEREVEPQPDDLRRHS